MSDETSWRRIMAANFHANPETTENLLRKAEAAGLLPEHITTARDYLRESLRLFDIGNDVAAGWAARAAWERANFLHAGAIEKTSIRAGRKSVDAHRKSNEKRKKAANKKHDDWQLLADEKWAQPQHANKSPATIAKLIAKDDEKPDTIRKVIKKVVIAGGNANA